MCAHWCVYDCTQIRTCQSRTESCCSSHFADNLVPDPFQNQLSRSRQSWGRPIVRFCTRTNQVRPRDGGKEKSLEQLCASTRVPLCPFHILQPFLVLSEWLRPLKPKYHPQRKRCLIPSLQLAILLHGDVTSYGRRGAFRPGLLYRSHPPRIDTDRAHTF